MAIINLGIVDQGELLRLVAVVTEDNEPVTPGTLNLRTKSPSGELTTLVAHVDSSLVVDAANAFHYDVDCSESGPWKARWWSTGVGQAAADLTWYVTPSELA